MSERLYPKARAVDILDNWHRSKKNLNGYVSCSKLLSPLVMYVHERHPSIFDITGDMDCLEVKLTTYGEAFYDGIMTYRNERKP